MCKIDLVLIILKGMSESESIVIAGETHILFLVVVLIVRDICANTMPSEVLLFLGSK